MPYFHALAECLAALNSSTVLSPSERKAAAIHYANDGRAEDAAILIVTARRTRVP